MKLLSFFWALFPSGKKGMEMWPLVFLILAIILLLFFLTWYGLLGKDLASLFDKLGELW
jgi:hypothetical protein